MSRKRTTVWLSKQVTYWPQWSLLGMSRKRVGLVFIWSGLRGGPQWSLLGMSRKRADDHQEQRPEDLPAAMEPARDEQEEDRRTAATGRRTQAAAMEPARDEQEEALIPFEVVDGRPVPQWSLLGMSRKRRST